jgi:S-layer like family, C-terminal region
MVAAYAILQNKTLIYNENGKIFAKEIGIFENVEDMRILSNPLAWRITELLSHKPMYPAQIAKDLKVYEQSVYYYIRSLLSSKVIEEVGTNIIRGGTARLYKTSSPSFGLEMNWGEKQVDFIGHVQNKYQHANNFFREYIINNSFQGLIIVGAPGPHGPYKSSARDGHYAVHLAFFLGMLSDIPSEFIVKLDSDAKAEKVLNHRTLISIGGPGTNIVTAEYNRYLPIKFNQTNFWSGLVDGSGKFYNSDNHGLIAKIKNPYNHDGTVIVIAGVRSIGTKSAVIALTNYSEEILKNYQNQEEWALIVQGFDMNSDGKIDQVDIVSKS